MFYIIDGLLGKQYHGVGKRLKTKKEKKGKRSK